MIRGGTVLALSAIGLGAATGAPAAVTFLAMISLQELIWGVAGDFRWLILPITVLGGALIGWTRLQAPDPEIEQQIADAFSLEKADLRRTFWLGLGAVFAVGFGGVIGPEAGIIAVTAQLSALVSLRIGKTAAERRTLG